MNDIKHTPGPWHNREGEIIADTREQTCCGNPVAGAEYMGSMESVCCGCPEVDGCEEDVIVRVTYERDIPVVLAAPDMAEVLEMLAAEADAGTVMIPSGLRLTIDAALIKAGRKAAPTAVRHVTIAGVDRDPPKYCSFCFVADCGGECSGDGLIGG